MDSCLRICSLKDITATNKNVDTSFNQTRSRVSLYTAINLYQSFTTFTVNQLTKALYFLDTTPL